MPWLISDIFNWLAVVAGFYFLVFGQLRREEREREEQWETVRVVLTSLATSHSSLATVFLSATIFVL